jgi:hypothetical protein
MVAAKYHGTRGVDVGVFDYNEWTRHDAVALSESGQATGSTLTEGSGGPVPIHDPFYSDPQHGHDRLWALVGQDQRSQLENKILMAVEWTGKGSHDLDASKSFVQFMFALEALFTFHEKVFVTPSIASQLAEYAAFVVGQDLDHRLKMAKMVKEFYEKRSGIVHGGASDVSEDEVQQVFFLMRAIVRRLTTDTELVAMKSMSQFNEWIQRRKYA